ncbi:DUF6503 family protein [Reichenbachiella versicolor]|uniref:DUF6503 family protein n=1 Tax=Reichenbachiella versicolor TaxID=1821036 RepID=UPI000D6E6172|nr:DUF6503 family protein [Reichenbachiella versicolor]
MIRNSFLLLLITVLAACEYNDPQQIVDDAIYAHGLNDLSNQSCEFEFRGKQYSRSMQNNGTVYTRSFSDSTGVVSDSLINHDQFVRYIDDSLVNVSSLWAKRYSSSINSVLYFFQLPYGLNDQAVIKEFVEQNILNGIGYNKVKITFKQDGGGEDYEDEFLYWFNAKTNELDFMAYAYATNGGGIRFREAINKRRIDGHLFQDYINYKPASKEITLTELDDLFEQGELIEVSRIINENIKILSH